MFVLTRPILQGRLRWPEHWDRLISGSSRFRRMWSVATAMWGIGLILDAAARVLMAFTLPPDSVPGLGTVLYVATVVILNVVTNSYYVACGVFRRGSGLYEMDLERGSGR